MDISSMKWFGLLVMVSNILVSLGQGLPKVASPILGINKPNIPNVLTSAPGLPPVVLTNYSTISDRTLILPPPAVPPPIVQPGQNIIAPLPGPPQPVAALSPIVSSQQNTIPILPVTPQPSCVCGVFLSGQFVKGSNQQPVGNPVLVHEQGDQLPCSNVGNRQCINKCLDILVKHLPNSPTIICGSMERDCHKERAYLWIQNCNSPWINTHLAAGREYCCKDGIPYKCPLGS